MKPTILRLIFNPRMKSSRSRACIVLWLLLLSSYTSKSQSYTQEDSYTRAEILVRSRQWNAGLSVLSQLLTHEPHNLKALNLTGLALVGKGDTRGADEYFQKALKIDPRFAPSLKNLSINEFNAHNYTAAEKHLEIAESVTPHDQMINLYLGEIFYRQKTCKQAIDEFGKIDQLAIHSPTVGTHQTICYLRLKDVGQATRILDLIPTNALSAPAQFDLALALDDAGLPARAIPLMDSVFTQFPGVYDIAIDRMIVQLDAKNFSQAIDGGRELVSKGHDTAEVENLLAESYENASEFQLAFDAYRKAINLEPQDEENYLDLASLCLSRRSFQTGIEVVNVGLASHPSSERLLFMRGLIHATQGDLEAAEQDFRSSESGFTQKDLGAIGLGASYLQSGKYDQAIKILRTNLHERPNDPSLLYLFAETLVRSRAIPGELAYTQAQQALEKSISLDSNLCLPHVALGKIYLDEKRYTESVQQFEKARSIDPTERAVYSHLAVAYRRLGEVDKANEALGVLRAMSEQDRITEMDRMKEAARKQSSEPEVTPVPQ
jgi:tetratricopeptide (TPR) repeat protein